MTTIREALVLASDHQQNGRLADAEAVYRLILAIRPDNAIALNNLGLIVPDAEAADLFHRAALALPGHAPLAPTDGTLDAAPDDPTGLFQCGQRCEAEGRFDEAAARYARAVAIKPDFGAALFRLAAIHVRCKRHAAAAECYGRALALAPDSLVGLLELVNTLAAEGRLIEAKRTRDQVPQPLGLLVQTAPEPRRTVLILGNAGKGNIPLDAILPAQTTTRITWYVEFATDEQAADLPEYDVALNAVGDADVLEDGVAWLEQLHAGRPVLNPADAVMRTRRDRLPALLAGLEHILVPAVIRLTRADLAGGDLAGRLEAAGIGLPVLMRPIVAHGGEGMIRADTDAQVAALKPAEADAYYFAAYHDFRSPDGYYRKYRMIFVDRQLYPYHLAISEYWLVHYFSADMMSAPWKRAEERAFLDRDDALLHRLVSQRGPGDDVPDGIDTGHAGAQRPVDLDQAPLGELDTGGLESQRVNVGTAAGGDDDVVGLTGLLAVLEADRALGGDDVPDEHTRVHVDALLLETTLGDPGDVSILGRQHPVEGLEQLDLGTQTHIR